MNIRECTLPVYTILTQLTVGALFVIMTIRAFGSPKFGEAKTDQSIKIPVLILLATAVFAAIFAHLHISKPYLSFLVLRNLGSSWLSRELLANLLYVVSLGILVFLLLAEKLQHKKITVVGWLALAFGFATDFCMSRIYLLPSQPAWNTLLTPVSFLVTTFLLGVATVPVLFTMDQIFEESQGQQERVVHARLVDISMGKLSVLEVTLCIVMAAITYFQVAGLFSGNAAAQASLDLLLNIYQPLLIFRLVLLFVGVGWLAVVTARLNQKKPEKENFLLQVLIACLLVMVAEILGRFLFYAIHVRVGL